MNRIIPITLLSLVGLAAAQPAQAFRWPWEQIEDISDDLGRLIEDQARHLEEGDVVRYGDHIALRVYHQDGDGPAALTAWSDHSTSWDGIADDAADVDNEQILQIVTADATESRAVVRYGDRVCLRTYDWTFLVAEPDGDVLADRGRCDDWERFTVVFPEDHSVRGPVVGGAHIGLLSYHGTFLQAHEDGRMRQQNGLWTWETFTVDTLTARPGVYDLRNARFTNRGLVLCEGPCGQSAPQHLSTGTDTLRRLAWWRFEPVPGKPGIVYLTKYDASLVRLHVGHDGNRQMYAEMGDDLAYQWKVSRAWDGGFYLTNIMHPDQRLGTRASNDWHEEVGWTTEQHYRWRLQSGDGLYSLYWNEERSCPPIPSGRPHNDRYQICFHDESHGKGRAHCIYGTTDAYGAAPEDYTVRLSPPWEVARNARSVTVKNCGNEALLGTEPPWAVLESFDGDNQVVSNQTGIELERYVEGVRLFGSGSTIVCLHEGENFDGKKLCIDSNYLQRCWSIGGNRRHGVADFGSEATCDLHEWNDRVRSVSSPNWNVHGITLWTDGLNPYGQTQGLFMQVMEDRRLPAFFDVSAVEVHR